MKAKKELFFFLYLNIALVALVILTNYIVDPFNLFHQPIWKNPTFSGQAVFTNLGQIDTYLKNTDQYDTILIGTSHTQNFIGKEISKALDTKGTLKLCLGGGHPTELEAMAKKAFSSKKVKKVLWGFETMFFSEPAHTPCPDRVFPYEWYSSSSKKYNLLLNVTMSKETTWSLIYHLSNYRLLSDHPFQTSLDKIYYYYEQSSMQKKQLKFYSKSHLKKIKKKNIEFKTLNNTPHSKIFSSIDEHFIPLIKNHPEIEFHILLIPYSYAYFVQLDQQKYQDILDCQRYLIEKCATYSNVHFYGFHTCHFPHNLANYQDFTHYNPDINRYMLYAIQNNQHRLTLANLDAYEKAMIENLRSFEVQDAYPQPDTLEDLIKNEAKGHSKEGSFTLPDKKPRAHKKRESRE